MRNFSLFTILSGCIFLLSSIASIAYENKLDTKNNIIYSTDHGPQGGDEINIDTSPGENVKNYGWAISSYGEHYGFPEKKNSEFTLQFYCYHFQMNNTYYLAFLTNFSLLEI